MTDANALVLETRDDAVQAVAKGLFERWKVRVRRQEKLLNQDPPTGRSYSTDAWEDLPPSFKQDFLVDAALCVDLIIESVRNNSHEPS